MKNGHPGSDPQRCSVTGGGIVADGRLLDCLRRLQCFGLGLMRMDLRQDSSRHTEAVDAITQCDLFSVRCIVQMQCVLGPCKFVTYAACAGSSAAGLPCAYVVIV